MAGKPSYRIVIPTDTEEYRKLIEGIDKENDALGKDSPIEDETTDIKQGVKDMQEAEMLEDQADALKKQAEKLMQKRNILQKGVLENERGWRKTLEGKYIKKIQTMGDFGYIIDRSPKQKPPPKA